MKQPERITDTHIYFWGSFYSQWAKYYITDSSLQQKFSSCEQYMMYHKAILFNDEESSKKILATNNVKKQKELGRKVKGFNQKEWDKHKFNIIVKCNLLKFSQNEDIQKELLSSGKKILVEASPYDKIYGVGLKWDNDLILDEKNWRGENILGEALMKVRKILRTQNSDKLKEFFNKPTISKEECQKSVNKEVKDKYENLEKAQELISEDFMKDGRNLKPIQEREELNSNNFGEKLLESANEALAHAQGKKALKTTKVSKKYKNKNSFYKDVLYCPKCGKIHIDKDIWSKRLHHKHLCLHCDHIWELDDYVFGISLEEEKKLHQLSQNFNNTLEKNKYGREIKDVSTEESRNKKLEQALKRVQNLPDNWFNGKPLLMEIKGSILEAKEDIIAQGCNCVGASGAGIAKYIAQEYPESDQKYKKMCNAKGFHLGSVMFNEEKGKIQAFCGTQKNYGKYLKMDKDSIEKRYQAITECLLKIYDKAKKENLSVALPRIGCGRARADWNRVKKIIQIVFHDYPVTIYWIPDRYSKK